MVQPEFKIKKKKILYVAYGGGHINIILSLYESLKNNPHYDHVIFGLTAAQIKLNALQLKYVSYLNYVDLFPQALEYGKMLSEIQGNNPEIAQRETYAYLGVNFVEMIQSFGLNTAKKMYEENGRNGFFPLESLKKIFSEINPDVVIATNSPRSERAALQAP